MHQGREALDADVQRGPLGTANPQAQEAPELCRASLSELANLISRREASSTEVVEAHLQTIESFDRRVKAFITVTAEEALDQARESDDRASRRSRVGPLDGVPIALKDLLDFKQGVPNTFGSDALRDFIPPRSSTSVDRVERAGLIAIGKTSVPEFGHKGTTDNVLIGPTSTPSCLGNNAGGSSGGSAAAVAAGMVPAALGSDGAGSIRIPASLCGIVGFKPSFGRIPSVSRPGAFRGCSMC